MSAINWSLVQARMGGLGVVADGIAGPATHTALFRYMGASQVVAAELGRAATQHLPNYGLVTPLRLAHFLAQASHETMAFRYFHEIWGPTPAQRRYEGRADLGNTQLGDGRRFAGRGIFQLTGRANYRRTGSRLGYDLVNNPDIAALPGVSLHIACDYWVSRGISALADADDVIGVTRRINGGTNGLDDRRVQLGKAKRLLL